MSHPITVNKDKGPSGNWEQCLVAVNQVPGEDPNAPGPPSAGGNIPIADLKKGLANAKSKWLGAKLSVNGYYVSTTTTTTDGQETVILSISSADKSMDEIIGCTLSTPAPDGLTQWTQVVAVGNVSATLGVSLEDCGVEIYREQATKDHR